MGNCIEWTKNRDDAGYGLIRVLVNGKKTSLRAHRIAWEAKYGKIPAGLVIDHLCRNPPCINTDHLEVVTTRTNVLRGIGNAAQNARKTHCVAGHELSGANIHITKARRRICNQCERRRQKEYKQRKRLARRAEVL